MKLKPISLSLNAIIRWSSETGTMFCSQAFGLDSVGLVPLLEQLHRGPTCMVAHSQGWWGGYWLPAGPSELGAESQGSCSSPYALPLRLLWDFVAWWLGSWHGHFKRTSGQCMPFHELASGMTSTLSMGQSSNKGLPDSREGDTDSISWWWWWVVAEFKNQHMGWET